VIHFLKTKRKLAIAFLGLLGAVISAPRPGHAQFLGYVSPQTVQSTLATNAACPSTSTQILIPNLGQTQHTATVIFSSTVAAQAVQFTGQVGTLQTTVSDVGMPGIASNQVTVTASGYYSLLYLQVSCGGSTGTYTAVYSGASSTVPQVQGVYLSSQIDKTLFNAVTATHYAIGPPSVTLIAPFGNTAGQIAFAYSGTGPTGGAIYIACLSNLVNPSAYPVSLTPSTAVGYQIFNVPSQPCSLIKVFYNATGTGSNTFSLDYIFAPPGGGQLPDYCVSGYPKSSVAVAISTATTTLLVTGGTPYTSSQVYVCGFNGTIAGTSPTLKLEYGTTTTNPCDTGTTALSGTLAPTTGSTLAIGYGGTILTVPAGNNFCVVTGGTTPSLQGVLTYVQQ